jgi:hypothetical protein
MSTNAMQRQHVIFLLVVVSILVGLWLLLEPGVAFMIVVGLMPFIMVLFFVRNRAICDIRLCLEQYQTAKHTQISKEK